MSNPGPPVSKEADVPENGECPNCGKRDVVTERVTAQFDYLNFKDAFSATFPAMRCCDCKLGWRDHRSEIAIDVITTREKSEVIHDRT